MRGWNKMGRRGNYDSANYMENADGGKVIPVGSSPTFSDSVPMLD